MLIKKTMFVFRFFGIPTCPDPRSSAKSQEIKMGVASGMFYVLTGGCVLALFVFAIEWLHHKRSKKESHEDRQEVCVRFKYFKCKTNTIPILMHQMHISTNFKSLFSATRAEKVGNPKKKNVKTVKEPKKKTQQILCQEIEPNPSKDRAMHKGGNPSF
jgi:hypothetical protein